MADSNITKQAIACALKELLKSQPLEKITVAHICDACGMNRKSFYYHFKDKYDLVNWIYYTEFVAHVDRKDLDPPWSIVENACDYFYENRDFYRKTLRQTGQNSFSDYLRDLMLRILTYELAGVFCDEPSIQPFAEFFADAFICALKKWLLQKDCQTGQEFCLFLKKCLFGVSRQIISRYNQMQADAPQMSDTAAAPAAPQTSDTPA